jgi:hypothetical protein
MPSPSTDPAPDMEAIRREADQRNRHEALRRTWQLLLEDQPSRQQTKLFAGMDCLRGQQDLFRTDGEGDA